MSLTQAEIDERTKVREDLIVCLLPSVRGDRRTAEYVVNNLTVHRPELLARAARAFA